MRRIAPVLCLVVLAACAGDPPFNPPVQSTMAAPPPSVAEPPQPEIATPPRRRSYTVEVDALLRELAAANADATPAGRTTETIDPKGGALAYTSPRVSRRTPTADPYAAQEHAYQANLETCLDGRFPAFCDRRQLTAVDAARVLEAEYQANIATCIDPEWQHLCRPELLPASLPSAISGSPFTSQTLPSIGSSEPRSDPAYNRPAPAQARAVTPSAQPKAEPVALRAYAPPVQPVLPPVRYAPACGENGSCYGDISTFTGRAKTTYVRGYFRRDGTYVRSHYRSRRR